MTLEERRLASLDLTLGRSIAETYKVMRHRLDTSLRGLGLTTPQFGVLVSLAGSPGCSNADLARSMHVTPQTMNGIVLHLESEGLVVRRQHPAHGVVLQADLTPEGQEVLERATAHVRAVNDRLRTALGAEDEEALLLLLERCRAAIADGELPSGECPFSD